MIATKEFIKALLSADNFSIYATDEKPSSYPDFRGKMELVKWVKNPLDGTEMRACTEFSVNVTGHDHEEQAYKYLCYHSPSLTHNAAAQTAISMLKEGDSFYFSLTLANDSDVMRQANVTRNDIFLVIERGKKRLTFFFDSQVTSRFHSSASWVKNY